MAQTKVPTETERVHQLQKHFSYLEKERSNWSSGIWQDIADYVCPIREDLQGTDQAGKIQGIKAYDGTAIYAVNLAADGTHGYMINPATEWLDLRLPRRLRQFEKEPSVRQFIEDKKHVLYYAYQNSNFYSEMRTFLRDGFSIGTASLYPERDIVSGKLAFNCLHPREGYIAEDKFGNVDTFFRKVKLTARQAEQEFGIDKLSEPIKNSFKNNPYQTYTFLNAVFPRTDFNARKLSSINKKYASIWCEFSGNKILKESGYDIFPYMVWRYSKSGGEVYGRSPAAFALPEIKSLNAIAKDLLGAAQMAVFPPLNVPSEMKGKVRLSPFGLNYMGSDFNRKISPILTGSNFPVGREWMEAKQDIIEKHFDVDLFLMFQRAQKEMTAREIIERMGEKASVLSARTGDLVNVLDSINDYVIYLETEAGNMPPLPDILMDYGSPKLDYVYMGPLAQAQKRLFETQGIRIGMETAMPIFQVQPETMDEINWGETVTQLLISNGFPQTAFNTPDAKMAIRQARQQAQMEDKQKVDADLSADTMKKLAQAMKNAGGTAGVKEIMAMLAGADGGAEGV